MVDVKLLSDAIAALEMLAKGLVPDSFHALCGGFGLDCLSHEQELGPQLGRDLAQAAQGLFRIGRGGTWNMKPTERDLVLDLAETVREIIECESQKPTTVH